MQNPVSNAYNLGIWERKTTQLNADLTFEQKLDFILKGLKFTGSFFYDNSIMTLGGIYDAANNVRLDTNTKIRIVHQDSFQYPGQPMSEYTQDFPIVGTSDFDWVANPWTLQPEAVNGGSITRRMMYQAQMSYNGRFAEKHTVGAMGLFKREEYAAGSMFPNYREDWVFRTTYDYDSRYFFEGNGAYNGSEKFSSDYRFDFFPSFAIGWYVSNEKFFKLPFMNKLKLRYSLGKVGDDSAGSRWLYQAQYSVANRVRLQTNLTQTSPYPIYRQSVVPNPDARWETATKNNFGIETGFFKDMLGINFDYFKEDRKDILIGGTSRSIPPYFGFDPPAANLGRVKANGYELEISFTRRMNIGLTYWMQTAITHTRNKIIERDDPALQVAYLKNAGYPIGQTRVQVAGDVYKTWDEIYASIPQQTNDLNKIFGFYDLVDFNADGIITGDDNAPLGFPTVPENTYNFSLGADYKGFSFMLQFYGVNNVTRYMPSNNYTLDLNVLYAHSLDYWSKDNPNASSFLPRWKTAGSTFIGNYFYYDGAYARLKTAEIAYNLQGSALKRLGVSGLKLYVNGNNLWFWSRMPDDRENNDYGGSADQGAYPMTKRINFGIDLNF
jgi:TonB-linked SusC/RagA family outer membrane protein